jgi:hypothetical protein
MTTDTWRPILRDLLPRYSVATLTAFVAEVAAGGKRLVHRATTDPPPIHGCRDYPCGAACAVAWLEAQEHGWQGAKGAATAGEVEGWFGEAVAFIQPHRWVLLQGQWDSFDCYPNTIANTALLDPQREAEVAEEIMAELARRQAA